MVIISRTRTKRRFFGSIGFKITLAFLLIISASFYVTDVLLTGSVRDYLYNQRIRQDSLSLEKLAATVAPLFQFGQVDALSETLVSSGGELGGRLLVLDNDGKIQFDSFSTLMGQRSQLPEVVSILADGRSSSYGIHTLSDADVTAQDGDSRVAYCAVRITGTRGGLGVLLYCSPVAELIDSLDRVERELAIVFVIVAVIALVVAIFFSNLLTKPINALTRTIQKMGHGDLSVRAKVRSSGELRTLAENYNAMAEQLESMDRSRSQFVSNASHELKTPLTTMKILLENVLYQPEMPEDMRAEFLGDMNHEIDRLSNVVGDLLTLTRMDSNRLEMKRTRLNLSETVQETIRLLTPQAEKRGQDLRLRVTPNVVMNGDRSKLEQIVYNLTENALKYTPDGGQITVSLQARGRSAVFSVQDNGVGIPEEDQAHIFERFYRVDKARSRDTGGTGLGLSIVRQLVTMHGGTITVQSKPGQGSTFTVQLPLDEEED